MSDPLISSATSGLLSLTINRPDRRNALNTALLGEMASVLGAAAVDDAVRAVVISGADGHFAAGADVDEIAQKGSADGLNDPRKAHWASIRSFPKPIIAGVDGYCLGGGCELALMADMIIAGPGARFGLPETNLGLIPGAGGVARLTGLIGRARAARLVLTGEIIDGSTAFDWGLASFLSDADPVEDADKLGLKLARRAPLALAAAKAALIGAAEGPLASEFAAERAGFERLLDSADKAEGIAAFREKRRPDFTGC